MSDGKTRVAISSKARSPTESLHAGYASCGSRSNKDLAGSSERTPHGIHPWRRKAKSEIITSKLRWNNHGKKRKGTGPRSPSTAWPMRESQIFDLTNSVIHRHADEK